MAALLATCSGLLLFASTTVCERLDGRSAGLVPLSLVKERFGLHLYNNSPKSPYKIWHNKFGLGWKYVFGFFSKKWCFLNNCISKLLWVLQVRPSMGLDEAVVWKWFKSPWKGHSEHFGVPFLTFRFKGKWLFRLYSVWVAVLFLWVERECDCGRNTHLCVKCTLNLAFQLPPGTYQENRFHLSLNQDRVYVGIRCLDVWLLNA